MDIELIIKEFGLIVVMVAITAFWLAIGGGNLKDEGDPK